MCVIHYYTFMFACTSTKRTGDSVCTDGMPGHLRRTRNDFRRMDGLF